VLISDLFLPMNANDAHLALIISLLILVSSFSPRL
jgi:hypothetical protein